MPWAALPWLQGQHPLTVGKAVTVVHSRLLSVPKSFLMMQVLQGMDHINTERAQQHWYLKDSILKHLHHYRESLLVIEEYDKLDCPTRAVLRQLITASGSANVSMDK